MFAESSEVVANARRSSAKDGQQGARVVTEVAIFGYSGMSPTAIQTSLLSCAVCLLTIVKRAIAQHVD